MNKKRINTCNHYTNQSTTLIPLTTTNQFTHKGAKTMKNKIIKNVKENLNIEKRKQHRRDK